jgi:hypothetical protein
MQRDLRQPVARRGIAQLRQTILAEPADEPGLA